MANKGVKTGALGRSSRLLSMAARVAGEELRHKVRGSFAKTSAALAGSELKARIAQAQAITDNLAQLKGAAMKAGQLLSIDSSDLLPAEAQEILSRLQGKADPVDFALLETVLQQDLGDDALGRFEAFDRVPAASASIGQVHRARYQGRDVAVKIQYPGIADSIDSDIGVLEKLADSMLFVSRSRIDMTETFEEIRQTLHLEADYERELANLQEYRTLLGQDPRFEAPEPIAELCGPRVLTMQWAEGVPLKDWIANEPTPALRERVGRDVLDLYGLEFFDWGFVQTDPNHANFLVQPDPSNTHGLKLMLLDFGATLRYDIPYRTQYRQLLRAVGRRDASAIFEEAVAFGLIDAREPSEARELFAQMLITSLEPFDPALQPFEFGNLDYVKRSRDIGRRFTRSLKYSPPPRKLLFLHRKLGGVFQLLRKLKTRIDLVPYWQHMVEDRPGEHEERPDSNQLDGSRPSSPARS